MTFAPSFIVETMLKCKVLAHGPKCSYMFFIFFIFSSRPIKMNEKIQKNGLDPNFFFFL